MKVVLASGNAGKVHELSALLSDKQIEVIAQTTLNIPDIEETGLSFVENALLKARHAAKLSGLPALADDSGLVVPFLNGAPGIYSARYAGPSADSAANMQKLLTALHAAQGDERKAHFYCVLVFLNDANDPTPLICTGRWEGYILTAKRGEAGFGYDPVFYVPELNKTAAELPLSSKNTLSHRGQALRALIEALT